MRIEREREREKRFKEEEMDREGMKSDERGNSGKGRKKENDSYYYLCDK